MNDQSPTNEQSRQLEEIVAYLDGELSPPESARVEQRLAADESYRQKLQGLQRVWTALDELPDATLDDRFSQTTMEMIVSSARDDVQLRTQAMPIRKRKQRLSTLLLATAAALLGGLVFRLVWEEPDRALQADLPVIQYIDIYSQFRDLEFLRQLQQQLGDEHWSAGPEAESADDKLKEFHQVVAVEDRRAWLDELPSDERVTLRAKFNRFRSMPVEEQERLRTLHQQIQSQEDAHQLQRTMVEYQQWLDGLPSSVQFELRKLPLDERVQEVVSSVRELDRAFLLTPEDLRKLHQATRPHWAIMSAMAKGNSSRQVPGRNPEDFHKIAHTVREALPEDKRQRFDQLTPREQVQQISDWIRQAGGMRDSDRRLGDRRRQIQPSEKELEEFFVEEVDAATKEELLAMPRDRMQHQLRQMYRGKLPVREWDIFGKQGDRNRRHRGQTRGEERRQPEGPPPGSRDRRGPPRFREGSPGPPPAQQPPI
jgi:hypothetical protein